MDDGEVLKVAQETWRQDIALQGNWQTLKDDSCPRWRFRFVCWVRRLFVSLYVFMRGAGGGSSICPVMRPCRFSVKYEASSDLAWQHCARHIGSESGELQQEAAAVMFSALSRRCCCWTCSFVSSSFS